MLPAVVGETMILVRTRWIVASLLIYLGLVSVLAIQSVESKSNKISGTIAIDATGSATPIKGKKVSVTATLHLDGDVIFQGGGVMKLTKLHGTLQVGTTTFQIDGGSGEINKFLVQGQVATIHIQGKKLQLVLYGAISSTEPYHGYYYAIRTTRIDFFSPQSKLSSLYFLSFSGGTATFSW